MGPTSGQVVWFALFAILAAAGTWSARAYALRRRLVDAPGARRSHVVATPRGGGIAIAVAFLIAITAMMARQPSQIVLLACAGIGLALVAGIGWIDDHRPLSPWSRLLVHALAAAWLGAGFFLSGAGADVALIAFVSALVLTNVWNFMDGIDGLAATQAILAAIGLMTLSGGDALTIHLGLALIASTFGFLPFNLPRARIFLGDSGSGALGFSLALMTGLSLHAAPRADGWLALLPLSAFLLDAGLTLFARMLRRERWWAPHVQHAYQCWARRVGHLPVTGAYAAWTMLACGGVVWLGGEDRNGIAMALMAWMAVGSVLWHWLRTRPDAGPRNQRNEHDHVE